jgi:alanine-synthesizing transaminase
MSGSQKDFHRIKRLPPYVFEQVNKLKAAARLRGDDIIDFGMGNPDLPTPDHIVEKLIETVQKPRTHRYSASKGIPGLRRAQAAYYERRFGVKLNPDTQVVATLGSKEGFANMAQAITAPGDVILVPNPTYPIHAFGFIISGGTLRSVPASADESFIEAVDRAVRHSVPKPLALVLSYPSNPTAVLADLDFYKEVVDYARKHDLILLSDVAYAEIYFDVPPPPSILQVPGAMVENLLDARMAHGLRRRQRTPDRGADAGEILSRLRCIHAGAGCSRCRAERSTGLRGRNAPDLQEPA